MLAMTDGCDGVTREKYSGLTQGIKHCPRGAPQLAVVCRTSCANALKTSHVSNGGDGVSTESRGKVSDVGPSCQDRMIQPINCNQAADNPLRFLSTYIVTQRDLMRNGGLPSHEYQQLRRIHVMHDPFQP